nr:Rab family GTPase [Candidatus Sigynarchaeota archaeon]
MVTQNDHIWKIVAGGTGGVGKTTFLLRYLTHQFVSDTALTVGVQLHSHNMECRGKRIGLILWDLGGQERFRFIQPSYMKGAMGALLFYDASRLTTLFDLTTWIELLRQHASQNVPILLVGTKADIVDHEMLNDAITEAGCFVTAHELNGHIVTSSKTGENIEEAVNTLVDGIREQRSIKTTTLIPTTSD